VGAPRGGYTNSRWRQRCGTRRAPLIATVGFLPIRHNRWSRAMGFAEARVIASRLFVFEDRRGGKLRLLSTALGDAAVREAMVISDSAMICRCWPPAPGRCA